MATVIAIANRKGGVGKSTTAFNLAVALTRRGKRVLAIDNDPQGSLTILFGHDHNKLIRSTGARRLINQALRAKRQWIYRLMCRGRRRTKNSLTK